MVHLLHAAHEDLQVYANQGEEGGLEVDLALLVDRHVHPDQPLVGQQVGALAAKAERRVDLPEQGQQVGVVHQAPDMTLEFSFRSRKHKCPFWIL